MIKCEICGNEYENKNGFGKHLFLTHNIHTKEYYDKYLRKPDEGICPICGKETTFRGDWKYLKFCSYKCAHKNISWDYEKYGVSRSEFYSKIANDLREKTKLRYNIKSYNRIIKILPKNYLKLINHTNYEVFNCKCLICSKNIILSRYRIFYNTRNNLPLCYECNPKNPRLEDELFEYIKEIYKDETIIHDRNILKPKELDLYLPKLKIAFEFDGTYWHADPRFFNENDIIEITKRTAKEIWDADLNKIKLAENVGIKLYRIKEYDWLNNNEQIKNFIRSKINENSNNC